MNEATQDMMSKYMVEQEKAKKSQEEVEEELENLRAKMNNEK